ncbi:poly(ADP-ribose) glycohydrolase, partial [Paragonimus westermani]
PIRQMTDFRKPTGSRTFRQTSLEEGFSERNSFFYQVIHISVCTRKREKLNPQTTPDYRLCSVVSGMPFIPFPERYVDKWSKYFVRLPCSPDSLYPVTENGKKSLISRWNLIEKCLRQRISTPSELQEAVLSYNSRFRTTWNFNVFHNLCAEKLLPDGDEEHFFGQILPILCSMALNLPVYLTQASFSRAELELFVILRTNYRDHPSLLVHIRPGNRVQLCSIICANVYAFLHAQHSVTASFPILIQTTWWVLVHNIPIPLMRSGCAQSFTFSQLQIASLLANAFFCTFPRRNSLGRTSEFANFPAINFSSLLSVPHRHPSSDSRFGSTQTLPAGVVTYTRRHLGAQVPNWAESICSFDQLRIHISSTGTIEEAGFDTLQVDFANRYLGGGVLNSGCVQEEIMFVLRPELLAACLFMERLGDDETVIVEGVEQYSTSHGYADNFRWATDYRESQSGNQRDEWGRWRTTVVAMDALYFDSSEAQYLPKSILRELNKAYCGFTDTLEPNRALPSVVATGNWGCGAFRGDTDLKALIQMMACVQAGKALAYYSFGDQDLCTRLYDIYTYLASNKITVGNLWNALATLDSTVHAHPTGLYEYIKQKLT